MLKRIGKISLGFILFLLVILSLIPTFLSTNFGKDLFLNQLNKTIPGQFSAKDVHLSWFGKQKIENFELKGQDQVPIASIKSIESEKSLLSWLFTFHHPAFLRLMGLNVQIAADDQGVTNIEDALGLKKQASTGFHTPVFLENTNIEIKEDAKGYLMLKAVGLTRQDVRAGLINSSQDSAERGKSRSKRSGPNEESPMAIAMGDEEDRSGEAAAGLIPDEFRKTAQKGQFTVDAHLGEQQSLKLRLDHFPTLFFDQLIAIKRPELSGLLLKAVGDYIDVSTSQVSKGSKHQVQIVASSPFIHAKLQGQLSESTLLLDSGSLLQFEIPESNSHSLSEMLLHRDITISSPLKGEMYIDFLKIPLHRKPDLLEGKLTFNIAPNQFYLVKKSTPLDISHFKISVDAPPQASDLTVLLEAEGNSSIDLTFNLPKKALYTSKLDYQRGAALKGSMRGAFDALPSFLAKSLPPSLITLLGPKYALEFSGQLKEKDSKIDFALDSSQASFDFTMAIPRLPLKEIVKNKPLPACIEGTATVNQPRIKNSLSDFFSSIDEIAIPWKFDPENNALKVSFIGTGPSNKELFSGSFWADQFHTEGHPDFSDCPLELHLVLNDFQTKTLDAIFPEYPLKPALGDKFHVELIASRDINGDVNGCFDLQCLKGKDSEAFLKKLSSKFSLQDDNRDITFETTTQQLLGSTQFTGTLHQLFDEKGNLSLDSAFISVKGNLKHFPVKLMTHLATGDLKFAEKIEAAVGMQVDADVFAKIRDKNGPVKVDLKGLNGTLHLDGRIENGVLLLNAPLTATLKVTPQLEAAVISEMLPLLDSVISASNPIELTIPQEGFSLPLQPLSLTEMKIKRAEVMLNKMEFCETSPIGKAASLLGVRSKTVEVWFTPAYFSLNRGILELSRTDMLIGGAYPLASWGTVNFNEDDLHLIIGLSGQALKKAFSITGINNNYMLQIPLQGPIKKPQLDLAKAAPRVSALIAQSQGGPEGKILGTFFDVATDLIGSEKTPPPTTNPLPWEGMIEEKGEEAGEKDNFEQLPLHDIKKGAKKILKNIFGK